MAAEDLTHLRYVDFNGSIQTVSSVVLDNLDDFMPDSDMAPAKPTVADTARND